MNEMSPDLRSAKMAYPSDGYGADGADGLRLPDLLAILRRRLNLILSIFIVVVVVGVASSVVQTPKYTATALIMVDPKKDRVVSEDQKLTEVAPDSALVDSEIEVLKSPDLAARLIKELKLERDPEWNASLKPPGTFSFMTSAVKDIGSAFGSGSFVKKPAAAVVDVDQSVLSRVTRAIKVRRRGVSYVMEAAVESTNRDKAAAMANKLAELYLQTQFEARVQTATQANTWLTGRLAELKQEVQQKEAAAQAFRAEKGLLTAQGVSLTEQQIAEAQNTLMQARAEFAEKQARYEQVKRLIDSGGSAETIASALNSDVIRDLRAKESEVAQRQADLENRYGPLHPAVEKVRLERKDVQGQIRAEIARISTNLKNEADVVRARLNTLEGNLSSVRSNLVTNNAEIVRANELETDARAARSVYESFLERYHQVSQQGELPTVEARIVSRARAPKSPSSPNLTSAIGISLLAAFGLSVSAALIAERVNGVLASPEEVERRVGLPAIASVPALGEKDWKFLAPDDRNPEGYLVEKPMSGFAEAFRVLRTIVTYAVDGDRRRIIAVTSALPDEGKTTTSLCLGRIGAMSGQKVLLIDCDLRRRSINTALSISPKKGLLEVLSGEVDWRDVVGEDTKSHMHVLPAADRSFTPQDVFGSAAMRALLDELAQTYDLVVLDCAPALAVAETRVIAAKADAVVMTCRAERTPVRAVQAALEQLGTVDARVAGIVLNYVNPKSRRQQSYYGYYTYGKSYYYQS